MSEQATMKRIKRWIYTLIWLRHNGYRWKTNSAGGRYTIAFDKKEEIEWVKCLPEEYQAIVTSSANQEVKLLKAASRITGCNYSELLLENRPLI